MPEKYKKKKYEYTETYKGKTKTYYCFDSIVKKKVTVGAVVLCREKDRSFYFDDNSMEEGYKVNFYTLAEAFPSLKLPNVNYTRAGFSLKNERYHGDLDEKIAGLQKTSDFLDVYDNYLIESDRNTVIQKNMSFFIVFSFMVLLLGFIVIANGLFVRIGMGRQQYNTLRILGMERKTVKKYNILKYVKAVIPAAVLSLLSLYSFTCLSRYGEKLTLADLEANRDFSLEKRWYDIIKPMNLFQMKYIAFCILAAAFMALFICVVVCIVKPDDRKD